MSLVHCWGQIVDRQGTAHFAESTEGAVRARSFGRINLRDSGGTSPCTTVGGLTTDALDPQGKTSIKQALSRG